MNGNEIKIAIQRKNGIKGRTNIVVWLRQFGLNDKPKTLSQSEQLSLNMSQPKPEKVQLEETELHRLKKELAEAKLRADAYQKMIEIAKQDEVARAIQNRHPKKVRCQTIYALKEIRPEIGLGRLCSLFSMIRQAYYQYFWRENDYQIEEELLIQEVGTIRKRQPMIGTRKLYGMLDIFMVKHQIKVGRDALFDILARNGMLVRRKRRTAQITFSAHWLRKYPNLIKGVEPNKPNQL